MVEDFGSFPLNIDAARDYYRLTPAAKSGIHELLGADVDISDAEVASWADNIKRAHREQGPWHYVDIPDTAEKYEAERDGRKGDNVIDKISDFAKVLADKSKPKREREQALRFLVHLVGDIHQPPLGPAGQRRWRQQGQDHVSQPHEAREPSRVLGLAHPHQAQRQDA